MFTTHQEPYGEHIGNWCQRRASHTFNRIRILHILSLFSYLFISHFINYLIFSVYALCRCGCCCCDWVDASFFTFISDGNRLLGILNRCALWCRWVLCVCDAKWRYVVTDKTLNTVLRAEKKNEKNGRRMLFANCTSKSDWERRDIAYDEVIASVNYFINIKRHQQIVPTFGTTSYFFHRVFFRLCLFALMSSTERTQHTQKTPEMIAKESVSGSEHRIFGQCQQIRIVGVRVFLSILAIVVVTSSTST